MASIDLEALLQPISDADPCGPDLEGEPDFQALEIAATRRPEREVSGVVTPAEEPDWPDVQSKAVDLLQRSKDLRTSIILTEALIHNEGLSGLSDGLQLIHDLLQQKWDDLHPRLDPEDSEGSASFRINRLKNLGDRSRVGRALRLTPLASSRLHGGMSLGDAASIARGLDEGEEGAAERHAAMLETFQDADAGQLQDRLAVARDCRQKLKTIVVLVDEKSDVQEDLGLDAVDDILGEIRDLVEEHLRARGLDPDVATGDETADDENDESVGARADAAPAVPAAQADTAAAVAPRGPITSREDAVKSLDLVCRYFEQHEPSSPVPLLLRRAKKLVAKDFMAILKDLAPEGLNEAEKIVGGSGGGSNDDSDDDDED